MVYVKMNGKTQSSDNIRPGLWLYSSLVECFILVLQKHLTEVDMIHVHVRLARRSLITQAASQVFSNVVKNSQTQRFCWFHSYYWQALRNMWVHEGSYGKCEFRSENSLYLCMVRYKKSVAIG